MDDRKSTTNGDDPFVDASDEFPFYDCIQTDESGSSSISEPDPVEANASVPEISETSPEISSPDGLRRRKPFLKDSPEEISLNDSKDSNPNSSVSFENNDRKYGFPMENERKNEILEVFKARLTSGSAETKENSIVTSADAEKIDYSVTVDSQPVAFVPIISCSAVSCGGNCVEKTDIEMPGANRIIPLDHKLKVTVSLTLPESDYNRNLGNFQLKLDFLSNSGKTLQSSRRPCMLHFKSEPIRILLTFFKIAPLLTGYSLESQTLNIKFNGFKEKDTPTSCLRVTVEQRAEFRPGAGIPEIYAASLALESKLPLLKRILWNWKTTIFIWFSMMMFCMELLFTLLCCKPIIIPRARLGGSTNNNASENSDQIRR